MVVRTPLLAIVAALALHACTDADTDTREGEEYHSSNIILLEMADSIGVRHDMATIEPQNCMFALGGEQAFNRRDHDACIEQRTLVGGIAVADLDGNGYPDLLFTRPGGHPVLYRNKGGRHLADVSSEWGLNAVEASTSGAAFADLDDDGDLDLILATVGHRRNIVLQNTGGRFVEWSGTGLNPESLVPTSSSSVMVEDVNGDGLPDILIMRWYTPQRWQELSAEEQPTDSIMINGAGGVPGRFRPLPLPRGSLDITGDSLHRAFSVPAGTVPVADFGAAFMDLDGDGRRELFVAGDWGTSRIVRIDGGSEGTELTAYPEEAMSLDVREAYAAMGVAVGDATGDGISDLFVTAIKRSGRVCGGRPCLDSLHNQPDGNMLIQGGGAGENIALSLGVIDGGWGWGAGIGDLDGDGFAEIVMTNGWDPYAGQLPEHITPFAADRDLLWTRGGEGEFVDVGREAGFGAIEEGRAVLIVDIDMDGRLDVVVTRPRRRPDIYMNRSGGAAKAASEGNMGAIPEELRNGSSTLRMGGGSFFLSNLVG